MFYDARGNQVSSINVARVLCVMFDAIVKGHNKVRVPFPRFTTNKLEQSVTNAPVTFLTGYYGSGKSTLAEGLNGGATPMYTFGRSTQLLNGARHQELSWLLSRLNPNNPVTSLPATIADIKTEIERLTQNPGIYVFDALTNNEQNWLVDLINKHLSWLNTLSNSHFLFIYPLLPKGINNSLTNTDFSIVAVAWATGHICQLFEHLTRETLSLLGYSHPNIDLPLEALIVGLNRQNLLPLRYQNQTVQDLIINFNRHPVYDSPHHIGHYNIRQTAREFLQMFPCNGY